MGKLINKLMCIVALVVTIGVSLVTDTFSVYSSNFTIQQGSVGYVSPQDKIYKDIFYNIADSNDKSDNADGKKPNEMTGNVDGFIPMSQEYDLASGYTFSISVTTSVKDDFAGMGFYIYAYASTEQTLVDGVSIQVPPEQLLGNNQFTILKRSYNSLSDPIDTDEYKSIIFREKDFWGSSDITYPTTLSTVKNILTGTGWGGKPHRYDSYTMDFKVAVKQINDKDVKIQLTINDYCFGNFSMLVDKIEPTDANSVLCVGVKTLHTGDKYFTFSNAKIEPYQTFVEWRDQTHL